jgi:ABC-2 type transport system ATP-binding protein
LRPPLLEIAGVNKTFGKNRVLSDISFSVGEAEVVGFAGPNGAGKTTTMKVMCGLLRADSGTVSLAGFDVARQRRDFLERAGVLIESPGMFPSLSAGDHLAYLGRVRGCHEPAALFFFLPALLHFTRRDITE